MMNSTFGGLMVTFSTAALRKPEPTDLAPAKHRKARVVKKLLKRTPSQPAMYEVRGVGVVAHPSFRTELEKFRSA